MPVDSKQRDAGGLRRFEPRRPGFWDRTGLSAEAVYWVIFTLGLAMLALLIMEILGSSVG